MKCSHKNKHTEMIAPSFGTVSGIFLFGKCSRIETPPTDGYIITYCADCGKEIKRVILAKNNPLEKKR